MIDKLITELAPILSENEGRRSRRYKDSKGIWTIGIGHNMQANPLPPDIAMFEYTNNYITQEMIDRLFQTDIMVAIRDCQKLYPKFDTFPEPIQIALVDIMFNFGYTRWSKQFKETIAHINAEEWDDVEDHLQKSLWYKQVGRRAKDDIALIDKGQHV